MKKLKLLAMSLMAMSFLASCNNSALKTYTVKFHTNSGFIEKDGKIEFVDEKDLTKYGVKDGTIIDNPGLNDKMKRFTWGEGGYPSSLSLTGWFANYDKDEAIRGGDLKEFDFSKPIVEDIDLYPDYAHNMRKVNFFTLTLDLNGGSFDNEKFDATNPIFEINYMYDNAISEGFVEKFNKCITNGYILPPAEFKNKTLSASLFFIDYSGDEQPISKAFPLHSNLKVFVKWGE